jgi:hypothetical protein
VAAFASEGVPAGWSELGGSIAKSFAEGPKALLAGWRLMRARDLVADESADVDRHGKRFHDRIADKLAADRPGTRRRERIES